MAITSVCHAEDTSSILVSTASPNWELYCINRILTAITCIKTTVYMTPW